MPNATTYSRTSMVKAILFDLDDTLFPCIQHVQSGYRAAANFVETIHGVSIYQELLQLHQSDHIEETIASALAKRFVHVDANFLSNVVAVHRTHSPQIQLHDDAVQILSHLHRSHIKSAVVVGGDATVQREKVTALGLTPTLNSVLYTSELLGSDKIVEGMQVICLQLDVPASNTAYVSSHLGPELASAQQIGIQTVLVNRNVAPRQPGKMPSGNCCKAPTIESLTDLPEALNLKS